MYKLFQTVKRELTEIKENIEESLSDIKEELVDKKVEILERVEGYFGLDIDEDILKKCQQSVEEYLNGYGLKLDPKIKLSITSQPQLPLGVIEIKFSGSNDSVRQLKQASEYLKDVLIEGYPNLKERIDIIVGILEPQKMEVNIFFSAGLINSILERESQQTITNNNTLRK